MPIPVLKNGRCIVGKLTSKIRDRRESVVAALFLTASILYTPAALPAPQAWQATDEIEAVAVAFLKARIGTNADRTTVQAASLDPRHRLARCDQALEGFLRRGSEIKARTIVGVRCSGAKPWKVYVPVDLIVTATVLVADRTLPKGHLIVAGDLVRQQRDVSRLFRGYIGDPEHAIGQRLKTQLIAGKILKPAMLAADIAIRRGQTVSLMAASGSFNISVRGTAVTDGVLGQRIRVRNLSSGRVVEGIVRSREHVEILIPGNNRLFHAGPKVSPPLADIGSSNNDR